MKLVDAVYTVVSGASMPVTPQHIRDEIKRRYPELYGTDAAKRNVERRNFNDLDHALLSPIYKICTKDDRYFVDRSTKPFSVSLASISAVEDALDSDVGEDFEQEVGTLYVLSTGVYTRDGKAIVKIGFTTQELSLRIKQLYTTGAMFRFEPVVSYEVRGYDLLEQALHRLLAPFRLNEAREFFTDEVLPFVEDVVNVHRRIQGARSTASRS
ncbi:GIY-YIG nuclease family protein [Paraburkholderia megapolitana]|jgi:hypothetical protein|uniref:T5orf172 domain-containing protein n=1 Tax=Paraburkholderia megapolitana TaxID=420953 RepID=A0A1I3W255_9BURK|nr:GIY-YIG nuclease family protein [Paraburkholderia megapolitana]QDQ82199.1 GIY-YIG nuclease family protein [Paraburkholderia megapolitana]SFK00717.1 T5orf172 domain-containing protein [Paraburkholderia megapolitana]